MPEVGSSKIITLAPPENAIATDNLLFCPPDKFFAYSFLFSSKLTSFMSLVVYISISSPVKPLKVAYSLKCSSTVS